MFVLLLVCGITFFVIGTFMENTLGWAVCALILTIYLATETLIARLGKEAH